MVSTSMPTGLSQILPGFSSRRFERVSQSPVPVGLSRSNHSVQHPDAEKSGSLVVLKVKEFQNHISGNICMGMHGKSKQYIAIISNIISISFATVVNSNRN